MKKSVFTSRKKQVLMFLSFFFCLAATFAQSEAEISGTIIDATNSETLPGAAVMVTNTSTGFKAGTTTDLDGKYILRNLQLGGPYSVQVSYVGYQTNTKTGYTLNLSDKVNVDFSLTSGETLKEVVVQVGSSGFKKRKNLGSAVSITGKTLEKIPTTTRNYEDLANLSPLSTPNIGLNEGSSFGGISVAGSNGGSTGITLDGVNNRRSVFGGTADGPAFTISLEAIKEFEIVTNSYDVSGPRSSGGSIKAVTRSGSNNWSGAAWYYGSGGELSGDQNFNGSEKQVDFSNKQFGARISGPIIKDKLSFVAVFDKFNQNNPVGAGSNSAGFINFNSGQNYPFTQADVQNYVDHLAVLGVLPSNDINSQIGETLDDKTTRNIFLRLDWNINDNNNLSLKYNDLDYIQSFQAGADGFDNATLFSRGYPFVTKDKKFIANLKTRFTNGSNDLKVSFGRTERENSLADGVIRTPRVSVAQLNNMDTYRVGAGLATWVPEEVYGNNFQIINVLSKKIGKYNYTFGTDILINNLDENIPHNSASSFRYNTLNDFEAGNPIFFNKKFALDPSDDGRIKYTSTEMALFAQGEFDLTEDVKLEAGLRWDGTMFTPDKDPTNAKLENVIFKGKGLVNNAEIRDFNNIQPRVSFTWDKGGEGKEIVKVGAGFFSSQFTTQPITFAIGNSGSRFVEISTQDPTQLAAIHANYTANGGWNDLDSQITLDEYSAITGQNPSDVAPDVVVVDPDFDMPMTFKMNASYHKFFNSWLRLGASAFYNNTKNVPYFSNINLTESGTSALDGRATYSNGANPDFGNILVFQNSNWRATFFAATLEAYAKLPKGGNVSFSYTRSASKGFSYYNAGGGFDGGRPSTFNYDSYSTNAENWHDGNSIPNKIVFSFVTPEVKGFTLSGSLVAGQFGRFSASSGVNTGASGLNLAYIPTDSEVSGTQLEDPANPGETYNPYANFNQMLGSTSPEYREYINENRGKYADFNGGTQPWSYVTNMSLIKGFKISGTHKLTARMDVFNPLNLFGGYADGGFNVVSNTNLINENAGKYSVNTAAGRYSKGGDQFRIQFGLKYEF